jgi:S1-C subfamily serine protease
MDFPRGGNVPVAQGLPLRVIAIRNPQSAIRDPQSAIQSWSLPFSAIDFSVFDRHAGAVRPPILPPSHSFLAIYLSRATAQEPTPSAFSAFAKHLLLVEGDRGRGSASIIKFRGNPLIVTNAHVLSGNTRVSFRTLDNRTLNAGTFGVARDVDLAVFTQDDLNDGLEILENSDQTAAVGDEIVVLGNSLGKAVATELPGRIVGIGPELIEVDAKFVTGNSGSPIIHRKSGKVIALATFATWQEPDPAASKIRPFKDVRPLWRSFGYRLEMGVSDLGEIRGVKRAPIG